MTCTCGHHEHAHAQDVGMCGSPHGCHCVRFVKAPAVNDGLSMSIDHDKAKQDAEWLAGSEADTAERNLAHAYLALKDEVAGFEAMWEAREQAHDAALAEVQKDKERLDWFDRIWKDDDTTSLDKAWQSSTPGPAGSGRAGIDAARAAEPPVDILSDDWWDRETKREA